MQTRAELAAEAVVRKAAARLVPFLALLYFVSFLDRVNVGFAALTMNADIGLTASAYGLGAGIFFIGYFLFEIPSNLILERVGARIWIARIMVTWGLISMATAFVTGPATFVAVRFLLGLAEAGFFPGIILYLTYWFPPAARGRIIGAFMMAIPLSNVVGAPVSTALLDYSLFGLAGWQTMFLVEGVPAVILGVIVAVRLPDRPAHARWLDPEERDLLARVVHDGQQELRPHAGLRHGLGDPRVWRLSLIYFGLVVGLYGLGFWAPQIIRSLGDLTNRQVGLVAAIPYLVAAVAMYAWGRHSDATGERRWHVCAAALVGAAGFLASALTRDPVLSLVALSAGAVGIYGAVPVFWTLPTAMLTGTAAAGGIALINSVGNLGGYVAPFAIGWLRDATGGYAAGLLVLAGGMAMAGVLVTLGDGSHSGSSA
jgi:ACS family tartrate transporter-like MFS transporter